MPDPLINPGEYTPYFSSKEAAPNNDLDSFVNKLATRQQTFADINQPLYGYNSKEVGADRYKNSKYYDRLGFDPNWNNEEKYYQSQPWSERLGNGLAQMAHGSVDTFSNYFAQYGRDFDSLTGNLKNSWDSEYNQKTYDANRATAEAFPVFEGEANKNSWLKYVPFVEGSAAAYANVFSNLGFTVGTIGAAVVEGMAIEYATGGLGTGVAAAKMGKAFKNIYEFSKAFSAEGKVLSAVNGLRSAKGLAALGAESVKGVVNAYRMYHTAAAEASFEAISGYNEHKLDLIQDFERRNGFPPTGEDLNKIEQSATEVGNARFATNVGVLAVSNAVQWGSMLKLFKPAAAAAKGFEDVAQATMAKAAVAEGLTTRTLEAVAGKELVKSKGSKALYNVAEGFLSEGLFEEGLQNVIDVTTKDYYGNKYRNPNANSTKQLTDAVGSGFKNTYTTFEGLENVMVGGITGMITGGAKSIANAVNPAAKKAASVKQARINNAIAQFNQYNTAKGLFSSEESGLVVQNNIKGSMASALRKKDVYAFQNLKQRAIQEFAITGIQTGKFDVRLQQLEDFKSIGEQEFKEAFGMELNEENQKMAVQYIDSLKSKLKNIKANYEQISERFDNPYNPGKYDRVKETENFNEEALNFMAYEEAKSQLVLNLDTANNASARARELGQDIDTIYGVGTSDFLMDVIRGKDRVAIIKELQEDLFKSDKVSWFNKITDKAAGWLYDFLSKGQESSVEFGPSERKKLSRVLTLLQSDLTPAKLQQIAELNNRANFVNKQVLDIDSTKVFGTGEREGLFDDMLKLQVDNRLNIDALNYLNKAKNFDKLANSYKAFFTEDYDEIKKAYDNRTRDTEIAETNTGATGTTPNTPTAVQNATGATITATPKPTGDVQQTVIPKESLPEIKISGPFPANWKAARYEFKTLTPRELFQNAEKLDSLDISDLTNYTQHANKILGIYNDSLTPEERQLAKERFFGKGEVQDFQVIDLPTIWQRRGDGSQDFLEVKDNGDSVDLIPINNPTAVPITEDKVNLYRIDRRASTRPTQYFVTPSLSNMMYGSVFTEGQLGSTFNKTASSANEEGKLVLKVSRELSVPANNQRLNIIEGLSGERVETFESEAQRTLLLSGVPVVTLTRIYDVDITVHKNSNTDYTTGEFVDLVGLTNLVILTPDNKTYPALKEQVITINGEDYSTKDIFLKNFRVQEGVEHKAITEAQYQEMKNLYEAQIEMRNTLANMLDTSGKSEIVLTKSEYTPIVSFYAGKSRKLINAIGDEIVNPLTLRNLNSSNPDGAIQGHRLFVEGPFNNFGLLVGSKSLQDHFEEITGQSINQLKEDFVTLKKPLSQGGFGLPFSRWMILTFGKGPKGIGYEVIALKSSGPLKNEALYTFLEYVNTQINKDNTEPTRFDAVNNQIKEKLFIDNYTLKGKPYTIRLGISPGRGGALRITAEARDNSDKKDIYISKDELAQILSDRENTQKNFKAIVAPKLKEAELPEALLFNKDIVRIEQNTPRNITINDVSSPDKLNDLLSRYSSVIRPEMYESGSLQFKPVKATPVIKTEVPAIPTAPVTSEKQPTIEDKVSTVNPLDILENKNNKKNNRRLKLELSSNNTRIKLQEELDWIKSVLPSWVQVEDLESIVLDLNVQGKISGAFEDGVIYLNDKLSNRGTGYHESFHLVFTNILSEEDKQKYLKLAAREVSISNKDILEFSNQRNINYSTAKTRELMLEEHLADKFKEWKINKGNDTNPQIKLGLFRLIDSFIKWLNGLFDPKTKLFNKIDKGFFKDSPRTGDSGISKLELVPSIKDENGDVEVYLPANVGYEVLSLMTIDTINDDSGDSIEDKIKKVIIEYRKKYNVGAISARIRDFQDRGMYNQYLSIYGNNEALLAKAFQHSETIDTFTKQLSKNLELFNRREDENEIEEKEETKEAFDRSPYEINPIDSINKELRRLLSFNFIEYTNELGEVVRRPLSGDQILTSMLRIAADTPVDMMMSKIEDFGKTYPDLAATFNKFKDDLFKLVKDTNGLWKPTSNIRFYNQLTTALTKTVLTHYVVQVKSMKNAKGMFTQIRVNDASIQASKKEQTLKWEEAHETLREKPDYLSKVQDAINKAQNVFLESTVSEDELSNLTNILIDYFQSFGVTIVPKLARISILAHKAETNNLTEDQIAEIRLYSGILSQNNIVTLKDFSEINKILITNTSIFDEEGGAQARLNRIAAGNASLDPTIPLAVFKNAEGKNVYQITNPTHFTRVANNLRSEEFREGLKNQEAFLEDNILFQEKFEDYFENLNIGVFNGIGQDIVNNGDTIVGERVTFAGVDPRSYLVADMGLYLNYRQVSPEMKLSKGIVMQLEGTSTSYVADMPIQTYYQGNKIVDLAVNHMLEAVKQEYNKIKRNYLTPQRQYRGYNDSEKGRGFNFFEFRKELADLVYGDTQVDAYLKGQAALGNAFESAIEPILDRVKESMTAKLNSHVIAGKRQMLELGIFDGNGSSEFIPASSIKKVAKNVGDFLGNYLINRYINTFYLNQFLLGDASKAYKNEADITKRQKGIVGAIATFNKPGAHKVLFIDDHTKYISAENPYLQLNVAEEGSAEVMATDGMAYTSPRHRYEIERYAGKLDEKSEIIYKKILRGEQLSFIEAKYLESKNAAVSSLKTLTFGGIENVYIKKSEHTLIRSAYSVLTGDRDDLDTLYDKVDEYYETPEAWDTNYIKDLYQQIHTFWDPMPGYEYYHDMLNLMELEAIDEMAHNSASKAVTPKVTSIYGDIADSIMMIPNEFKGIQSETPSGKLAITEPTQLIDLITAEQNDNTPITVPWDTNIQTVGAAKKAYKEILAAIRNEGFKKAQSYFIEKSDGTLDIDAFFRSAVGGLEASGADQTTLELFSGDFNINLPTTRDQAEKLFLAHYSKYAFSLKVPGFSMALVTDYGHNIIEDIETGEIISDYFIRTNPNRYRNKERYRSRNLGVRYDTKGRPYFEVIIPRQFNFKIGDPVTLEELNSILGTRIPTQDKHSMAYLKVVKYLPAEYGSIIVVPHQIHYLSGSDLDIDKMYIQRKAFYINEDKQPVIYGEGEPFEEYIAYQTTENSEVLELALRLADRPYNTIEPLDGENKDELRDRQLQSLSLDLAEERSELKKRIKRESLIEAMQELGLPITGTEFDSWIEDNRNYNPNILNNRVLDLKIELLTNDSIQREIAITPATDQIFKDFAKLKGLTFDALLSTYSLYSVNGRLQANRLIKKGDIDIGIFAVANKVNSILSSNGISLKGDYGFTMQDQNNEVYSFNSFALNPTYESKFGRKNDTLSAFLGMSADSAKNPYPGLFNIGPETASTIGAMISLTVPHQLILSISNSSIIQEYSDKVASKNYALLNLEEVEAEEKSFQVGSTMLRNLLSEYTDDKGDTLSWVNNYLNSPIKFNMETAEFIVDPEYTYKDTKNKINKKLFDAKILSIFLNQTEISQHMRKVNSLMSLTKSLRSEFISEDQRYKDIMDLMQSDNVPFYFGRVIKEDPLYSNLFQNFMVTQVTKSKIFLDEAVIPAKTSNLILSNLIPDAKNKEELQRIKRSIVGYLTQGQYRSYIANYYNELDEDYSKATGEDKEELAEILDTLADTGSIFKLESIIKSNPENLTNEFKRVFTQYPNNEFLKFLRINQKDGLSLLETAYRASFTEEKTNKLIDSYRELYENKDTNIFAIKLLLHSLVKDSLYNRGKSYIKYVHSGAFKQVSYLLDQLAKTVNTVDTSNFVRYYISHIENIGKIPTLPSKYEKGFIMAHMYEEIKGIFGENNFTKSRILDAQGVPTAYKLFNTAEFSIYPLNNRDKVATKFLSSIGIRPVGETNFKFPLAIKNNAGKIYVINNIGAELDSDTPLVRQNMTYVPIETIGYRGISPYSFTQKENEQLYEHSLINQLKKELKATPNYTDLGVDVNQIDDYNALLELKRKLCK